MVSVNQIQPEGFYLDPTGMALPPLGSFSTPTASTAAASPSTTTTTTTTSSSDDLSKKVRKPYTITKSRESWTEPEHDKFLEALQLFDRDWKKIEAFIGSKTVIQIRSHAQKYFLKVQKSGTSEHLPPPRPKRKAAHPYPQKASKNAPVLQEVSESFQTLPILPEPGFITRPDSSSLLRNPVAGAAVSSWTDNSIQTVSLSHAMKGQPLANNSCSSTESTPRTRPTGEVTDRGNHGPPLRVLPDFAQVYNFIGSVFDPNTTGHLQKLKKMDPIDVETVLLLMRNLSINLTSPDFEEHRRLLSSYEIDSEKENSAGANKNIQDNRSLGAVKYGFVATLGCHNQFQSSRCSLLSLTLHLTAAMIIPEKNRKEICKYLFQEGVCYAKKDFNLAKHPEIDVPNLQVIKLMQSFKSKEYVRETFAWMHYYWYLTNDGIEFLRTYLNLPSEIVPATLKKSAKPLGRPMGGPPGDRPRGPPRFEADRPRFGDRDGYRGGPRGGPPGEFGGEKGGAPADFQPSFRGSGARPGFGRGSGGFGGAPPSSSFS